MVTKFSLPLSISLLDFVTPLFTPQLVDKENVQSVLSFNEPYELQLFTNSQEVIVQQYYIYYIYIIFHKKSVKILLFWIWLTSVELVLHFGIETVL